MDIAAGRVVSRAAGTQRGFAITPLSARIAFVMVIALAAAGGILWPDRAASARALVLDGPSLARLLRAMAGIKLLLAVAACSAVYWRLGAALGPARLGLSLAAAAAMAAGPGLIWSLTDVGAGAVLLHGGLFATILLLWRDPGMASRLDASIASRRAALR
jgi:hypothetical protein